LADVRPVRAEDFPAAARLLHLSAADMYDRFSGGRERALRVLERSLAAPGTASSADAVWVAELNGAVAGAMAAFPVHEAVARSRAFLRLALRGMPPWLWPGALSLYWAGGRAAPAPPASSFYIDALATAPEVRRRGVARALLHEAELQARRRGLPLVALDTTVNNRVARALYANEGFQETSRRPATRRLPGCVGLAKRV
jgi:ribosomal protein S18 acetylase RimI-like enzyme